jgi:hypothetical protein
MGTWDAGTEGKPKSPNIRKINLNLAVAMTDVPIIREQLSYGENGAGAYPVNLKKGYLKEDRCLEGSNLRIFHMTQVLLIGKGEERIKFLE